MAKQRKKASKHSKDRSKTKYPNLDPDLNLRARKHLIDYDYVDKLSESEKAWLDKFTSEYTSASFDKDNRKNLHKTKKLKKDCYDRNNRRNRDITTLAESIGKMDSIEDALSLDNEVNSKLKDKLVGKD